MMVVLACCACVCVWRVVRGPTWIDRIVGLDALAVVVIALIILATRDAVYVGYSAAVLIALVAYIGTIACARWLEQEQEQ